MPVLILVLFFGGIATLVETGACAVLYLLIVEVGIKQDIPFSKIPTVSLKSIPIIGGVLVILATAKGLSYFIVDAAIPQLLAEWVGTTIHSRYLFLMVLNICLLIAGCFMDVFSAIIVVVPLIIPLGEAFGIHPVHLGIIFLANLEVGYLTPPVGINLFLASYRFKKPLGDVYKSVLPFLLIMFVSVLLITYIPWLTTGLLDIIRF